MGWVTLDDGQHIFIGPGGDVEAGGPKSGKAPRPELKDLTVAQVDRIASRRMAVSVLPTITSRKGEAITVGVYTNPFHGVLDKAELQKRYQVRTVVDGVLNDARQFSSLTRAEKYATSWHRQLAKEEKPK